MRKKLILAVVALGSTVVFAADESSSRALETKALSNTNSERRLELFLYVGTSSKSPARAKGFHGAMYVAKDWKLPNLAHSGIAQTNRVDICSSVDNSTIVMMVLDDGPVYSSTNFGMTWTVITTPGRHEFRLSPGGPDDTVFMAVATLYPSRDNLTATNSLAQELYVLSLAAGGDKLVLTKGASGPAPALSIKRSPGGVVVSWPSVFSAFALQATGDLTTAHWIDLTNAVSVVGEENQVLVSPGIEDHFFRLRSR